MAAGRAEIDIRLGLAALRRDIGDAERDTRRAFGAIQADAGRIPSALSSATGVMKAEFRGVAGAANAMNGEISRASSLMASFLAVAGSGAAAGAALQMADAYTSLNARLAGVVKEGESVQGIFNSLMVSAQMNRADVEALATVYTRLRQSIADMGHEEAIRLSAALAQSLAISGAGAAEAASFLRQISQALASGVLRGDEFNSVMEANSRFARLLADELGVGVGELRAMAEQGQLTAGVIREAIAGGAAGLTAEFERMPPTVESALTRINNALFAYIGTADQASGVSRNLADFANMLADNFELLADVAIVAASAGLANLAGRGIAAVISAMAAGTAQAITFRGALAALTGIAGGPLALAFTAAATAFVLYKSRADEAREATDKISAGLAVLAGASAAHVGRAVDAQTELRGSLEETRDITIEAANASNSLAEAQTKAAGAAAANTRAQAALAEVQRIQATETLRAAAAAADKERAALSSQISKKQGRVDRVLNFPGRAPENQARAERMVSGAQASLAADKARLAQIDRSAAILKDGQKALESGALQLRAATAAAVSGAGAALTNLKTKPAGGGGGSRRASSADGAKAEADRSKSIADKARDEANELERRANEASEREAEKRMGEARRIADAARSELDTLRSDAREVIALFEEGFFEKIGAQNEGARAIVQTLVDIAAASGDATEALKILASLRMGEGFDAAGAKGDIEAAAGDGRKRSDEEREYRERREAAERGDMIQPGELRNDFKEALREAAKTGDWADVFANKAADRLSTIADRAFDGLFNAIFQGGGGKGSGASGGGIGGILGALGLPGFGGGSFSIGGIFASLFGGKRAGGGPTRAGKAYLFGENGPEIGFSPGNLNIMSASATRAAVAPGGASMAGTVEQHFHMGAPDASLSPAALQSLIQEAAKRGAMQGAALVERRQRAGSSL